MKILNKNQKNKILNQVFNIRNKSQIIYLQRQINKQRMQSGQQSILQLFSTLKCKKHNDSSIVQICVSTQCQSDNRLCCLQCVDQDHMGNEHILISTIKFSKLMNEFHLTLNQKQILNKQILSNLQKQQQEIKTNIEKYYKLIEQSLTKQNQLTSYNEIKQLLTNEKNNQQIIKKLNDIVDCHVWMLQTNCHIKQNHYQHIHSDNQHQQKVKQNLHIKYNKLEKKLKEINNTCEQEIKEIIKKRTTQVKKLFHLFDQIKYNLQDDGKQLQQLTHSMSKIKINQQISNINEKLIQQQQQQVKQVFDFMGNVAGGQ